MAKCKYCGKSAGFFSRYHDECKTRHEQGMHGLSGMLKNFFQGNISASKMGQNIVQNKAPYFLSDDDIATVAEKEVNSFASKLKRPFSPNIISIISDFIQNIGISYSKLNRNGVMTNLGQKLIQGYHIEYFASSLPMNQVNMNSLAVTNIIPLSANEKDEVYMNVLNRAASNFMRKGQITDAEEQLINSYSYQLGLSLNNMPNQYASADLDKIGQAIILKNLEKGILPQKSISVPVLLCKGECALWVYHNVTMLQEKIQREYRGRSGGFSFRIFKGVTYRTGQFKGRPVENSYLDTIGNGSLVVTNKHLYFHCATASVKIPYSKLVGVTPYSDGLEVHKEETKQKRTVFQGFDSWFIIKMLSLINK